MGVPTSEVGYTSATTGRGDHEVYKGHVVALENIYLFEWVREKIVNFLKNIAHNFFSIILLKSILSTNLH
jgi:hypothetical protein